MSLRKACNWWVSRFSHRLFLRLVFVYLFQNKRAPSESSLCSTVVVMPVWQVGSDQLPGTHVDTHSSPLPKSRGGWRGREIKWKIDSWVKIKRERSLTVSIIDRTVLTWESWCVFPEVTSPWLKSSRKVGKEKYLSITECKVLLPEFVLLCKRLSTCSQWGGHHLKTCLSFCHPSQHETWTQRGKQINMYFVWLEGRVH